MFVPSSQYAVYVWQDIGADYLPTTRTILRTRILSISPESISVSTDQHFSNSLTRPTSMKVRSVASSPGPGEPKTATLLAKVSQLARRAMQNDGIF